MSLSSVFTDRLDSVTGRVITLLVREQWGRGLSGDSGEEDLV